MGGVLGGRGADGVAWRRPPSSFARRGGKVAHALSCSLRNRSSPSPVSELVLTGSRPPPLEVRLSAASAADLRAYSCANSSLAHYSLSRRHQFRAWIIVLKTWSWRLVRLRHMLSSVVRWVLALTLLDQQLRRESPTSGRRSTPPLSSASARLGVVATVSSSTSKTTPVRLSPSLDLAVPPEVYD